MRDKLYPIGYGVLREPLFGEADLIRVLCGNLADLLEAARPLEPETIALVSLAALRG